MEVPKSRDTFFGSIPTPESVRRFMERVDEINQSWFGRLVEEGGEKTARLVEKTLAGGEIQELTQE